MTDLVMTRGDDRTLDHVILDDPDVPPSLLVFAPGDEVWFTAKWRHSDGDDAAVIAKSTTGGGVAFTPGTAEARTTIDAADTRGLPALEAVLVWDLQRRSALGGLVHTLERGRLIVRPDVTLATGD